MINTFCYNWPFEDIHDINVKQHENEFDTPELKEEKINKISKSTKVEQQTLYKLSSYKRKLHFH